MRFNAGLRVISIVNGTAGLLHAVFWIAVFFHLPALRDVSLPEERLDLIVTYGLGVADMVWCVPLLLTSAVLLPKRFLSGWLIAQMANVLWWYSYTFILFREWRLEALRPGTLLFLPFALFSFWSAYYLWRSRAVFCGVIAPSGSRME